MSGMTVRRIPFLDLRVSDPEERAALLAACNAVFDHGRLINGPEVEELETRLATHTGRQFAVGVGSGTDALYLALRALDLGPGDEVITTALSWIATANAIRLTGAQPVFADIGPDLNIEPESVRRLLTPRTRAILPVHYAGKMCRMDALLALADEHGLAVVEDASQAFGARFHGREAGAFGHLAAFSANPMKLLAACGEAGVVVGDNQDLRDQLCALRYNGMVNREVCVEPGLNGRLDTLQAAILLARLDRVANLIARRRQIAAGYSQALRGVVETPSEAPDTFDVYYTYLIRTDHRDALKAFLATRGVEALVRDPILMPDQPAYRAHANGHYPRAQHEVSRLLALPAHEKLGHEDEEHVARAVLDFFGRPA